MYICSDIWKLLHKCFLFSTFFRKKPFLKIQIKYLHVLISSSSVSTACSCFLYVNCVVSMKSRLKCIFGSISESFFILLFIPNQNNSLCLIRPDRLKGRGKPTQAIKCSQYVFVRKIYLTMLSCHYVRRCFKPCWEV